MGFRWITWNFLETSHGKGPVDGIRAAVKNTVDQMVAYGTDLQYLISINLFRFWNVFLIEVQLEQVCEMEVLIDTLPLVGTIGGTMKIHQIMFNAPGALI